MEATQGQGSFSSSTSSSDEEWNWEEHQWRERMSKLSHDRKVKLEARDQMSALAGFKEAQHRQAALDAELDSFRQHYERGHNNDFSWTGVEDCSTSGRHSGLESSFDARTLAAWRKHEARHSPFHLYMYMQRFAIFEARAQKLLTAANIPWPPDEARILAALVALGSQACSDAPAASPQAASQAHHGTVLGARADILAEYRRAYRVATLRWHPDKWQHVTGALQLPNHEKAAVLARVHRICQNINEQWAAAQLNFS
ncbi:hypothetical protein COCOBI_11-5730 [Coccomyxa sp. Obi]|nr:hypothetical protein COCOBI_11-5730 [Coccomyxa sp. Obi]